MPRLFGFISVCLLVSGALLLLLDRRIYEVSGMARERKFARLFGWIELGLFVLILAVVVFLY